MALLVIIACIFGNKHKSKKTIIEKQITGLLLVSMLTYIAIPQTSLAYEVGLKNAPARKLVAPIQLLHNESFQQNTEVIYGSEYSDRMSSSVISNSPVQTKSSTIQSLHLAYSEPQLSRSETPHQRGENTTLSAEPTQYTAPKVIPSLGSPIVLEGEASYYSRAGCLGCNPARTMANGQPLDDEALTMAIGANLKHLVGYRARVTNVNTNLSVDVLITDTGGFYKAKYGNRVADLTIASKQAIGMYGSVGQVRVEVY